jgi:hypothetical protein
MRNFVIPDIIKISVVFSRIANAYTPPLGAGSSLRRHPRSAQAPAYVAANSKAPALHGLQSRKSVSIIKEQVMVLIFTGRDFSLGVTERAKLELCFYIRRRLEPAPSGGIPYHMPPSCRICNSAVMNISICNAQFRHTGYNKISVVFSRIANAYTLRCRITNSAGREVNMVRYSGLPRRYATSDGNNPSLTCPLNGYALIKKRTTEAVKNINKCDEHNDSRSLNLQH